MINKNLFILGLIAIVLLFSFTVINASDENPGDVSAISQQLETVLQNQADIIEMLNTIRGELHIIKIRSSVR